MDVRNITWYSETFCYMYSKATLPLTSLSDTPHGKVTFQEHLKNLGSWGTQVDIQAASDCFNMAIFVYSSNTSGIIRWERKAVPINHGAFVYTRSMPIPMLPFTIHHMELALSQNHYISVIPTAKGTKLTASCDHSEAQRLHNRPGPVLAQGRCSS